MAKVKDTVLELARSAGISAEEAATLEKALSSDSLANALDRSIVSRAEYSRSMDQLRADQQSFDTQRQQWTSWYETAKQQYAEAMARGGNPASPAAPAIDTSKYIDKDSFDKAIAEARNSTIALNVSIMKDAMRAQAHYAKTFNEELDLDALEAAALKANKPLKDAYRDFIADKLDAKTKADRDAEIAKAKAEGYQEAMSKHNLPIEGAKTEPHVLYDALDRPKDAAPLTVRERQAGFTEEWNKATSAA